MNNKHIGEETEFFVAEKLRSEGLDVTEALQSDEEKQYDMLANGFSVEVKSCKILVKNGKFRKRKHTVYSMHKTFGMIDFEPKKQLQNLRDNGGFVAIVLTWQDQKILMGFVEAIKIPSRRRIKLTILAELDFLNLKDFAKYVQTHTAPERVRI